MSKKKKKVALFEDECSVVESFEDEVTQKIEKPEASKGMIRVLPLKDWRIKFNEYDIVLKEGEEVEVPAMFEANLKTEKVI